MVNSTETPNPKSNSNDSDNDQQPVENAPQQAFSRDELSSMRGVFVFNGGHTTDIQKIIGSIPDEYLIPVSDKRKNPRTGEIKENIAINSALPLDFMIQQTTPDNVGKWLYMIGTQIRSSDPAGIFEILKANLNQRQTEQFDTNLTSLRRSIKMLLNLMELGEGYILDESVRDKIRQKLTAERLADRAERQSGKKKPPFKIWPSQTREHLLQVRSTMYAADAALKGVLFDYDVRTFFTDEIEEWKDRFASLAFELKFKPTDYIL
jgi:hypothetical protein